MQYRITIKMLCGKIFRILLGTNYYIILLTTTNNNNISKFKKTSNQIKNKTPTTLLSTYTVTGLARYAVPACIGIADNAVRIVLPFLLFEWQLTLQDIWESQGQRM